MDDNGLYVTTAQMNFFMNRDNGEKLVREVSPEFVKYYNNCKLYNLVYDMMEHDPKCAVMYWDAGRGERLFIISYKWRGCVYLGKH
jgi:hypothetical protein